MIGSAFSAIDISRDIARVAKEVHIASRSVADETNEKLPRYDNLWLHSMVREFTHGIGHDGNFQFGLRLILEDI